MAGRMNPNGQAEGPFGPGCLMLVVRALSCSVEVFLHKSSTFGERYIGPQAALAMLLIFLFPALCPEDNPEPMLWFLGAFFVAIAAARVGIVARVKRGEPGPHSMYTGTPRIHGRMSETTVKRANEPIFVIVVGAVVHELSAPLGSYLMLAGVALLVSANLTAAGERRRVLDMHDAFEEQRALAERWRSMRGE